MAQFDVHRFGSGLVIDCQSNLLSHIDTRFVVPLVADTDVEPIVRRLNPRFDIDGASLVMLTQSASAVRTRDLGEVAASLSEHSFEITDALDVLISGV